MAESQYAISAVLSVGQSNASFATWNSSTSLNATASLVDNDYSYNTLNVSLSTTSTFTAGAVTFQASLDGVAWFPVYGCVLNTIVPIGPTYTLLPNTDTTLTFNLTAIPYFQILLSTAIVGTGALTIGYAADSFVGNLPTAPATIPAPVNLSTSGNHD